MVVDCMMLEDVELEPEVPSNIGETEYSQTLRAAVPSKNDCVLASPARPRFETVVTTELPSAGWWHPRRSSTDSAPWKTEQKHLRTREAFPPAEMQRSSPDDAGAEAQRGASGPCTGQTFTQKKHAASIYGSFVCFCLHWKRSTATETSRGEQEAIQKQSSFPTNSFVARDRCLGFLTFLVCGLASLCCWQFLLSLMPYIENTFFNGIPLGNSLMGVYQVGCICVQLVLMFIVESMRPGVAIAAGMSDAALALLFPVVIGSGSSKTKMVLAHMVALLFGVNAGMICGCCLAVASALPYNFIGAFSVGQGIAGLISFIIGLAFKQLFDLQSAAGLSRMLWLTYGISCGISVVSACLLVMALRQPWAARQLARYWDEQRLREPTRRWTLMWRRWKGQPENTTCTRTAAAAKHDAAQGRAAASACVKGPSHAVARAYPTEDTCTEVEVFTTNKQQGSRSHNVSRPGSRRSALTTVAAGPMRSPVSTAGSGTEDGVPIEGTVPGKLFIRSSDTAAGLAPSTVAAEVETPFGNPEDTNPRHDPPDGSDASVAFRQCSLEEPTNAGVESRSRQYSISEAGKRELRISCRKEVASSEEASISVEKHQPSRGWRYMLKNSGLYLISVFLNFFVTLNLYPRVGPIMWHSTSFSKDGSHHIILFGVFCVGDLVGKCLMDISKTTRRLSWLMIKKKLLLPVVASRLGIAVFFLLGAYMTSHWFFNNFAYYVLIMLLLAVTNGWCATTSLLYVCTSVERLEEREVLGPASVLVMQLGIMAGAWTALAYRAP